MLAPRGMIGLVTVLGIVHSFAKQLEISKSHGLKSFDIGSRMFPKANNNAKNQGLTFFSGMSAAD
jgi:hypothetical protein